MSKIFSFIEKKFFTLFIIFLFLLNLFAIIAPIAAYFNLYFISEPIYFIYNFSCHQFHWRSIHFFNHQMAWCARDTFIWLGMFAVSLAVNFRFIRKGLKWYWMIPFTIPIALDGGIQTIATVLGFTDNSQFYLSTNFLRMVTGSIFGMGLGVIIAPYLYNEQIAMSRESVKQKNSKNNQTKQISSKFEKTDSSTQSVEQVQGRALNQQMKNVKNKTWFRLLMIYICLFFIYIFMVFAWKITSPDYPPHNFLDHKVREAPSVEEWIEQRCGHC